MTDPHAFVYGDGLFQDVATLSYADQLEQMSAAPFDGVVLWALHVAPNGDVSYNDTLAVSGGVIQPTLNPALPGLLGSLRGAGSVTSIGASIGPYASDFEAIAANPHVALLNLRTLIEYLSLDSLDLDYEASDPQTLPAATGILAALDVDLTYCPYSDVDFWLDALATVYGDLGRQPISRLNLQVYGDGEQPMDWVEAVTLAGPRIGVTDALGFVAPGYMAANTGPHASDGTCPTILTEELTVLADDGIGAAWVWCTSLIFQTEGTIPLFCTADDVLTPAGYANAIIAGLSA